MTGDLILVSLSAYDDPTAAYRILALLGDYDLNILDVSQADIHGSTQLSLLIRILPGAMDGTLKDILYGAHEQGLAVQFLPVTTRNYQSWTGQRLPERYILTLLGRRLTSGDLAAVVRPLEASGLTLDGMRRLSAGPSFPAPQVSGRQQTAKGRICVECSLSGQPVDMPSLRAELMSTASELDIDVSIQADDLFRRNRRLMVFDMDSTLIDVEMIDELAEAAGVREEVARITEEAMRGKLDFKESLRRRTSALRGLPESALQETAERIPLVEGVQRLFRLLQRLGYRTAILSGGFSYAGDRLQKMLGVDYVHANTLEIENGCLTGRVLEPIVDGERKAELLSEIAAREQLSLEQVIAVGDGANDIPMLSRAGLGIAFRAKPLVRESADHAITELGLDSILYLMGIHDREVDPETAT